MFYRDIALATGMILPFNPVNLPAIVEDMLCERINSSDPGVVIKRTM